jgi:hypothetical protein
MDLKKRSLERRVIVGSLPLKKRCFRTIEQLSNDQQPFLASLVVGKAARWSSSEEDLPLLHESNKFPSKLRVTPSSSLGAQTDMTMRHDDTASPSQGGCHVITSRTQTYCRRRPCYKGSTYCKIHYQQLVLKKGGDLDGDAASEESRKARNTREMDDAKVTTSNPSTAGELQQQQQDKRFTGFKGEVRCDATTTRGRACTYTAVDGTRYCCMHADYATNPPPRRGSVTKQVVVEVPKVPTKKSKSVDRSSSQVSDSSKSTGGKRRNTAEKLAQMHADSPYPLLSMFSSDQWGDKRVKIAVGPFEGHVGLVEKWSNGWVGVRIPEVGLHNRRSFELYIDSEEEPPTDEDTSSEKEKKTIRRCISRDAETPSPLSPHPVGMRTPSPKALNGSGYQPVTPNPSAQEAKTSTVLKAGHLEGLNVVSIPQVTPTEAQGGRVCVNTPLIASLLVAQQDRSKLDLLFGTAAADRGRRSARRPKMYEDTGMLDKKRSRKISLDTDA